MRPALRLGAVMLAALQAGCTPFEYSPTSLRNGPRGLNAAALERLGRGGPGDRIRFAVISDTHAWYDELGDAVAKINADTSLDFAVCLGDVTQFGYAREWEWFDGKFSRLRRPGLLAIGNHDLQADGAAIFARMYGPTDFAFTYRKTRFIVFNDNARGIERGVPDFDWLERELAGAGDSLALCAIAHAPPYSTQMGPEASARMTGLFARYRVRLSVHGHNHNHSYGNPHGGEVPYLLAEPIRDRAYTIVELSGAGASIERVGF